MLKVYESISGIANPFLFIHWIIGSSSFILATLGKSRFFLRQEFVQFLIYAFGEELAFAWEELDDDGSNELSEDEWFQAVKRIGPAKNGEMVNDGWLKRHLNPKKHR